MSPHPTGSIVKSITAVHLIGCMLMTPICVCLPRPNLAHLTVSRLHRTVATSCPSHDISARKHAFRQQWQNRSTMPNMSQVWYQFLLGSYTWRTPKSAESTIFNCVRWGRPTRFRSEIQSPFGCVGRVHVGRKTHIANLRRCCRQMGRARSR